MNKLLIAALVLGALFVFSEGGLSGMSESPPIGGIKVPAAAVVQAPAPSGQSPVPPALAEASTTGGSFNWPDDVATWTDSHGYILVPADVPVANAGHMQLHEDGIPHDHLGNNFTPIP